jgi:outer membrane protein assembly factor BamB
LIKRCRTTRRLADSFLSQRRSFRCALESLSIAVIVILGFLLPGCSSKKARLLWEKNIPVIGSQSSPRTADLDLDGTLDIVIGTGKNEFEQSDQGILAFNGATGDILWQQQAIDQMYGSATFLDVSGDKVPEVFIGGRSKQLMSLEGRSGKLIWTFQYEQYADDPILSLARYNFNNSIVVSDLNGDGLEDLLTVNGGNQSAEPDSEKDRFPGVLMVLDPKTGFVIAADTMPDGKESYMSPVFLRHSPEKDGGAASSLVVFGTGGETISGSLFVAHLSSLAEKKLHLAKKIASETGHGFIAPPSIVDITGDGHPDIVAISHASTVFAIDGRSFEPIWRQQIENTECSNSFAVGYFTSDNVPDFFTFVSMGKWPNSTGSVQVLLDGKTGHVVWSDSLGCTGFSSPVASDLNGDGRDEAIISVNDYDCSLGYVGRSPKAIQNRLLVVDFEHGAVSPIDQTAGFKNIFSTPWIGDLDADGNLDLVYCNYYHYSDLLSFLGMRVRRIDLGIKIERPVAWGGYMGTNGDGCFITD